MPQEHNFQALSESSGGGSSFFKDVIYVPVNYAEQNDYLKISIGCVWGMGGRGRGWVALQSLLTNIKGTSPFNFLSNEPYLKFLRKLRLQNENWLQELKSAPLIESSLV